ncbi:MAG TPA: hypothetical protein VM029_00550 [Opitutaceae bacterium]|nr:hypothetical protein [Opitutaceae bacterium]
MKILIALLVLTAPAVRATSDACCLVQDFCLDAAGTGRPPVVAAAKSEKSGKTPAPAPTPPANPPPKQPAPKPPAHLFM